MQWVPRVVVLVIRVAVFGLRVGILLPLVIIPIASIIVTFVIASIGPILVLLRKTLCSQLLSSASQRAARTD